MSERVEIFEDVSNPLDGIEELLSAHDWVFSRMNEDELFVQVTGPIGGEYRMLFVWQEDISAMQFTCQMDLSIDRAHRARAANALADINAGLWLGHFNLPSDTNVPEFCHTSLFRGMTSSSGVDHVSDLVDIAFAACERYFPAFEILAGGCTQEDEALSFALLETEGTA